MATLRPVTSGDYPFLYELLKEKTPEQNISHTHLPTYDEHVAFNEGKPYKEDYIILNEDGQAAGRVYLTRANEVGIHIKRDFRGQHLASEAIDAIIALHPGESILANIAPKNYASQRFFEGKGFHLVQYTYKWDGG